MLLKVSSASSAIPIYSSNSSPYGKSLTYIQIVLYTKYIYMSDFMFNFYLTHEVKHTRALWMLLAFYAYVKWLIYKNSSWVLGQNMVLNFTYPQSTRWHSEHSRHLATIWWVNFTNLQHGRTQQSMSQGTSNSARQLTPPRMVLTTSSLLETPQRRVQVTAPICVQYSACWRSCCFASFSCCRRASFS